MMIMASLDALGHFNPRCPGIGCRYRLVPLDVERALQHAQRGDEAWRRFEQLRSQCHLDFEGVSCPKRS